MGLAARVTDMIVSSATFGAPVPIVPPGAPTVLIGGMQGTAGASAAVRGLGSTSADPGMESSVATFQDGVYLGHPRDYTMPDFYRRISERLRHKDRAIDLWDYERLVLEAFPSIYKVKCLNHTQYEPAESQGSGPCSGGVYRELAPGHVTLVALPNLRGQVQRDPLKPYTSLGVLSDIQAYLAQRCSGFVQLHVKNPQFEEVRIICNRDETYEAFTERLKALGGKV